MAILACFWTFLPFKDFFVHPVNKKWSFLLREEISRNSWKIDVMFSGLLCCWGKICAGKHRQESYVNPWNGICFMGEGQGILSIQGMEGWWIS
jgi:hypothetical protein